MIHISEEEFRAISNWRYSQYFFRSTESTPDTEDPATPCPGSWGSSPLTSSASPAAPVTTVPSPPARVFYSPVPTETESFSVIRGVAEKYTFTESHRFGKLSIVYYEDFTLTVAQNGRTLEIHPVNPVDQFWLVGFVIIKPSPSGDIVLTQRQTEVLLPRSYYRVDYSLLESDLDPRMVLL